MEDEVAKVCINKYDSLPKTGKPNVGQWTTLACFVKARGWHDGCNMSDVKFEVVSLGTGSKCIGQSKLDPEGYRVNDSHAEIMARRGFLRYLYHEVSLKYSKNSSEIFHAIENTKCVLKDDVSFHFFVSDTPCGDASIFPKEFIVSGDKSPSSDHRQSTNRLHTSLHDDKDLPINSEPHASVSSKRKSHFFSEELASNFRQDSCTLNSSLMSETNLDSDVTKSKKPKVDNDILEINETIVTDIYRTGAKCIKGEKLQDLHLPGPDYHVLGVIRSKPGRGDQTLSLSCSDKIARWLAVGPQGALLSYLTAPVCISTVTIGGNCPFSYPAMHRALISRTACINKVSPKPFIKQAKVAFPHRRSSDRRSPCASSIVWCKHPVRSIEVAVDGLPQGLTKNKGNMNKTSLMISKIELLKEFIRLIRFTEIKLPDPATYQNVKASAPATQSWREVKKVCFPAWPHKPEELEQFKISC